MRIRDIDLGEKPVAFAPMEDISDPSFRRLCKEQGADLMYSEFVSADGLIRDAEKSLRKLDIADSERPVGIQIYGKDPDAMVEAALRVEQAQAVELTFLGWTQEQLRVVLCEFTGFPLREETRHD